ncbi:MAG: hypothetical protein GY946_18290, partial [bacterium]|nr:hypothetical protein [bacterium]
MWVFTGSYLMRAKCTLADDTPCDVSQVAFHFPHQPRHHRNASQPAGRWLASRDPLCGSEHGVHAQCPGQHFFDDVLLPELEVSFWTERIADASVGVRVLTITGVEQDGTELVLTVALIANGRMSLGVPPD